MLRSLSGSLRASFRCSAMPVAALLQCLDSARPDDFGLAVVRACFEGWASRIGASACVESEKLRAEIAQLRSELVESQRLRALSQARVQQLELQLATEQDWVFEAARFSSRLAHSPKAISPHSRASRQQEKEQKEQKELEQVMSERDQAMLEREELRLQLAAMQVMTRGREASREASRSSSPRSPVLARAQLAAATRQLEDCFMGLGGCWPQRRLSDCWQDASCFLLAENGT